ncbi:MAG: signal peptidase I [Fimbriimonadaceae bacterium]|nr:signal peptidase I [Fimbriimonadaceae bacterium]
MDRLFTENSTWLVGGLVAVLVLMRIALACVQPQGLAARLILWFWHPEARHLLARRQTGPAHQEQWSELYSLTLLNMNGTLLALGIVFFVIRPFLVQAFFIPSQSMQPTLMGNAQRKDRVLVNRYLYHLRPPERQDIIVFHAPPAALDNPERKDDYIKRLIGLPGDKVEVRGNRAYINDQPLNEPYLDPSATDASGWMAMSSAADWGPQVVPPGHYFVLGDNRNNSKDSRLWHRFVDGEDRDEPFLAADQVVGKAMCVFWPPQGLKLLGPPPPLTP